MKTGRHITRQAENRREDELCNEPETLISGGNSE